MNDVGMSHQDRLKGCILVTLVVLYIQMEGVRFFRHLANT